MNLREMLTFGDNRYGVNRDDDVTTFYIREAANSFLSKLNECFYDLDSYPPGGDDALAPHGCEDAEKSYTISFDELMSFGAGGCDDK